MKGEGRGKGRGCSVENVRVVGVDELCTEEIRCCECGCVWMRVTECHMNTRALYEAAHAIYTGQWYSLLI